MPIFRCTSCDRRVNSPVVIGAGDCPNCGGDVVFDIRRSADEMPEPPETVAGPPREQRGLLRRLWRR